MCGQELLLLLRLRLHLVERRRMPRPRELQKPTSRRGMGMPATNGDP